MLMDERADNSVFLLNYRILLGNYFVLLCDNGLHVGGDSGLWCRFLFVIIEEDSDTHFQHFANLSVMVLPDLITRPNPVGVMPICSANWESVKPCSSASVRIF